MPKTLTCLRTGGPIERQKHFFAAAVREASGQLVVYIYLNFKEWTRRHTSPAHFLDALLAHLAHAARAIPTKRLSVLLDAPAMAVIKLHNTAWLHQLLPVFGDRIQDWRAKCIDKCGAARFEVETLNRAFNRCRINGAVALKLRLIDCGNNMPAALNGPRADILGSGDGAAATKGGGSNYFELIMLALLVFIAVWRVVLNF